MYPKIYNGNGEPLADLDNIIKDTAVIKRVVNGEFTFTFEAYEQELKSEYFNPENSLEVDGQMFDIRYIEQRHEGDVTYNIQCEHVNYRLEDGEENLLTSYMFAAKPEVILADILAGTGFSVGAVDFTNVVELSTTSEITRKGLIKQLASLLGGEIEYTNKGFTINILNTIGKDNGYEARFGKNLKGISKIIDARGGLKTYYQIDLLELKNSNEYIEYDLGDLEVIGVGDAIRIVDKVIGLDVQNRIVSIEYNPIFAINTSLEISNRIELITDTLNQIENKVADVKAKVTDVQFKVTDDAIVGVVTSSDEYQSLSTKTEQNAEAISLEAQQRVIDITGLQDDYDAKFLVTAQEVSSKVSKTDFDTTIEGLDMRMTDAESSITQNSDQIQLKVSKTDYTGKTVSSLINQDAESIMLQANKIDIIGATTFRTGMDSFLVIDEQVLSFIQDPSNPLIKLALGFLPDKDGVNIPAIVLGAGNGQGNDRGYITKGQGSLDIFYIGGTGNVNYIQLSDSGINVNGNIVPVADQNGKLVDDYIESAQSWHEKLSEIQMKSVLEDGTKNWDISWSNINVPTDLVTDSDIANFVSNGELTTKLGQNYVVTGKIYANQITGNTFSAMDYITIGNPATPGGKSISFDNSSFAQPVTIGIDADGNLELTSENNVKVTSADDITMDAMYNIILSSSYGNVFIGSASAGNRVVRQGDLTNITSTAVFG